MDTKVANIKIAEKINWHKVAADLTSLKHLKEFAKNNNWRPVVSGGYGLDLFLSLTTRTHNDVDLIIYGKENREEAIKKISEFILNLFKDAQTNTKHENFYLELDASAPGFGANIYFVETAEDPFADHQKVKKSDGEIITNTEDQFPKPRKGKIGDLEVEIQDQNAHLADILSKQNTADPQNKYDQDIENLRHITDPQKVDLLLKENNS